MNIEVNLNNLTKEEQEQFNALVEKANKPKSKVWKPEVGEEYFCIDTFRAKIIPMVWDRLADGINNGDNFCYAIGNCFKTRGEAEFALERLKVIAEMKRYITEHDDTGVDWNTHLKVKYSLGYNYDEDRLFVCVAYDINRGGLYAGDSIVMEDMIKEIGEDRIEKYYFGVGEN